MEDLLALSQRLSGKMFAVKLIGFRSHVTCAYAVLPKDFDRKEGHSIDDI